MRVHWMMQNIPTGLASGNGSWCVDFPASRHSTKGFGQQAPLTPEYQKVLQDSMADQVESECDAVAVG